MGFAPFYFWSGVGLGGAHLGEAFVELAGDVGDDTELALDEHELGAVVHFVFLGAEEAFEAGLDGFAIGVGDFFGENFGRDGFHPGGEAIAFGAQVIQNFRLGAELGFIGGDAVVVMRGVLLSSSKIRVETAMCASIWPTVRVSAAAEKP
jgi:hypothetical protein